MEERLGEHTNMPGPCASGSPGGSGRPVHARVHRWSQVTSGRDGPAAAPAHPEGPLLTLWALALVESLAESAGCLRTAVTCRGWGPSQLCHCGLVWPLGQGRERHLLLDPHRHRQASAVSPWDSHPHGVRTWGGRGLQRGSEFRLISLHNPHDLLSWVEWWPPKGASTQNLQIVLLWKSVFIEVITLRSRDKTILGYPVSLKSNDKYPSETHRQKDVGKMGTDTAG